MKILSQYNTLINYSIDLRLLNKNIELSKIVSASYNWKIGGENVYIFTHDTFFKAKDSNSDTLLINYHKNLEIHCTIDDVEKDAVTILKMQEASNIEMGVFLKENTQSFFDQIGFVPMHFTDEISGSESIIFRQEMINSGAKAIKRIMGTLTYEEMSEEERNL